MLVRSPVLLVKTHAFGDALICTPAVKELVGSSKSDFWVLTGDSAADVWERFPGINKVFVAPVPPSGTGGYLELVRWSVRNRKLLKNVRETFVFQGSPAIRRWIRYSRRDGSPTGSQ